MNKKIIFVTLFIVVLAACTVVEAPTQQPSVTGGKTEGTQELMKFESKQDIINYLQSTQTSSGDYYDTGVRSFAMEEMADMVAAPSAAKAGGESASDYSTTNVQVEGVDEADFVKNDGKYIYIVSQDQLIIVNAYPADDAEIVSETEFDGTPVGLFVNDDRLVVFVQNYDYVDVYAEYDYIPRPRYTQKTHAIIYDISDREDPDEIKDYDVKGNYFASRMIGDYVYLIVQDYVYYYNRIIDVPVIMEGGDVIVSPEVYYFDNPETNYNFNTVMSFSIEGDEKPQAKTFMMGYSIPNISVILVFKVCLLHKYF